MSILTGHNHYVMSAFFHPTEDLIVTSSLDQSVRVWDSSGLKQKTIDDYTKVAQINQDLFGSNDVMVKFILEGHERGVNWAYFHPTLQLIVSAADDKVVKLWRYNDTRAWEIDSLRGHSNNVSCAIFHSQQDYVISNSEDKSIRVWDFNKNTFLYSYKREVDRFWVLNAHPNKNLVAAGHDNGIIVFKFERERPASCVFKGELFYIKDKYLRKYNFDKNSESTIGMIKKQPMRPVRNLSFVDGVLLTTVDNESQDSNDWEYLKLSNAKSGEVDYCSQLKKGSGYNAVFSGRKFVYLDKNRNIQVENPNTGQFKQVSLSIPAIESIFTAHPGRILIKTEEKIYLYDFEQSSIIAELNAPGVKYVAWAEDMSRVAFMSKHNIILTSGKLEELCSIHEIVRIKSGAFDENGIFLYTTLNHMKYCLPFGDSGIIKTIEDPIYLVKIKSNGVYYLDREGNCNLTYIDATEYRFKFALSQGKTRQVKEIMGKSTILGDSIISYLQKKGHPQVALKFVKDDLTKFKLAIECGNIKSALSIAHKLKNNDCWDLLAQEALEQGDYETVEKAYQRTNAYEKLSFLYLINGNTKDLQMMSKIATMRKDNLSRFHNSLLLGDVETRVQVLEDSGQISLAYVTAKTHGLEDKAKQLESILGEGNIPTLPEKSTLILPPTPVYKLNSDFNWPLLTKQEQISYEDDEDEQIDSKGENLEDMSLGSWTDGISIQQSSKDEEEPIEPKLDDNGLDELGAWGGLSDIPGIDLSEMNASMSSNGAFEVPSIGKSIEECWVENSDLAVDHIAAGSFRTAMDILSTSAGIINFTPLKSLFLSVYSGSRCFLPSNPLTTSIAYSLQLNQSSDFEETKEKTLPMVSTCSLESLKDLVKIASKEFTDAKLSDSKDSFLNILHNILFVVCKNKREVQEIKELTKTCMEYIVALRMELLRKDESDTKKGLELSAYFTHTKLSQVHIMLSLVSTMFVHYKAENYLTAAEFAKRLKKLSPPPKLEQQANFVIQNANQKNSNKFNDLAYEPKNPFVMCSMSLVPIYAGSESIKCSFCSANYLPNHKDKLCVICNLGSIGKSCSGLDNLRK
jgi:coatomer subunit alpha